MKNFLVPQDIVVLCGGLGTRLRSKIGESQKVMAKVAGRPLLDILLEHIEDQGFRRVILCTGYQAHTVEQYYREKKSPLTIEFSKESEPLGTGGALKLAEPLVKAQRFFVLNGDSFCPVDFKKFLQFHQIKKALVSMVLSSVEETKDYGTVIVDADSKEVRAFVEKGQSTASFSPHHFPACRQAGLPHTGGRKPDHVPSPLRGGVGRGFVNAGVYCFEKDIFQHIPKQKKCSLEHDVFPNLVEKKFYGFVVNEGFVDIGTPERYKNADSIFREGK